MFDVDWNADGDVDILDDLITLNLLEIEDGQTETESVIEKINTAFSITIHSCMISSNKVELDKSR